MMTVTMKRIVLILALNTGVGSHTNAQGQGETDDAVQRLTFMKESAQVYALTTGTNGSEKLKLVPDALLRWTNPVSGLKDGTLFFWTSDDGRPYAALQVFQIESGIWLHEFQSLATASFRATRDGTAVWTPNKPGVTWEIVPDAPKPAKSQTQRMSQMKAIVERFSASDDFEGMSRWELRSLSKPLLRYSGVKQQVNDGAVFAFVHTTDPEVFLTLEAKDVDGQPLAWHYSLAPMTAYALKVSLDGKLIWEKPWTKDPLPTTEPYRIIPYKP